MESSSFQNYTNSVEEKLFPKPENMSNAQTANQSAAMLNNGAAIENGVPPNNQNQTGSRTLSQTIKVNIDLDQDNEVMIESTKQDQQFGLISNVSSGEENNNNDSKLPESTQINNTVDSGENNNTAKPDLKTATKKQATVFTPTGKKIVAQTLDRKQFTAYLKGEKSHNRPRTVLKPRLLSSSVPSAKVPEYADQALAGKNIHITDPLALTDIIDELVGRRVQALDANDYLTARKTEDAMAKLRNYYRVNDRESLYNTTVASLAQRKQYAEDDLQETRQQWKDKWRELDERQKDEQRALHERHVKEHEDLEGFWRDPSNYGDYTKRNAVQLEHLAVERSLAMTGRFEEAEQYRKMNEKNDKLIAKEQYVRLQQTFEQQRQNLIDRQEKDAKKLMFQQDLERKLLSEKEKSDIDVKKLTIENATRVWEDEKQFRNFCAHMYKREPSVVLPPTVTTKGGSDLPTMPQGRIFPRGVDDRVRIFSKPQTAPLSLPALKFKKYKVPNYFEKPKKEDDDDDE